MMSHDHRDIFAQKTGADGEKAVPSTWARGGGGLLTHKPSQGTLLTLNDESKEEEVKRKPDQIKGVDNLSYPQLDPKWGPGGTWDGCTWGTSKSLIIISFKNPNIGDC